MELYTIENNKLFMSKLLKSDLFDVFEVREIVIHTAFKTYLDGSRNVDFFQNHLEENPPQDTLSSYVNWAEVKPSMYQLVLGKKLPTYFKIVLSTNESHTKALSDIATTFFLNITYKENRITCSTGTAYAVFSLDKSSEELWDKKMKDFLFKNEFI